MAVAFSSGRLEHEDSPRTLRSQRCNGSRGDGLARRAVAGADLRSEISGLPADLPEHGRLLFRVRLHLDAAMPGIGLGPQCLMRGQSLLRRAEGQAQQEEAIQPVLRKLASGSERSRNVTMRGSSLPTPRPTRASSTMPATTRFQWKRVS